MSLETGAPGWSEYKMLVLEKLERLPALEQEIGAMRVEIALLKQKAGLWGAVAGLIPGALAALVWYLSK